MPSRRFLALAGALFLGAVSVSVAASGEPGVRREPREPSSKDAAPVPAVKHVARKVPPASIGHLDHPVRLASLFTALNGLESGTLHADVQVIQLGDSHTASDYGTSVARALLAKRFGDGGRGFIPMGPPHRRQFQSGESMARGIGFEPDEAALPKNHLRPAGLFGPTGIAMDARAPGASLSSELTASADHIAISYLAQPGGGSFDVLVDGQSRLRVTTSQAARAPASRAVDVKRGPHMLEVRAVGDGPVRIYGARLQDDALGVTLDALGVNGAKATTPLATDEAHFAAQMAAIAPSLAIVAYGTNEAGDATTTPEEHASAIRTLVERVKKGAPEASCLVLGPPDRAVRASGGAQTLPKLPLLIAAQRRAADEAGCAFFDQAAVMGASGAIGRWASESPPRARRDLVHMTRAGYATLAEALVQDLVSAYEGWNESRAVAVR